MAQPAAAPDGEMHYKYFKYRIYPNQAQQVQLNYWLELNRELYNAALLERREAYKRAHVSLSYYDQAKELPAVREARPEYYGLPITVLRGTLKRVDTAFRGFFARLKARQKAGYPRFVGRGRCTSFTYGQLDASYLPGLFQGNYVRLPKFGAVKIRLHRPLERRIKTITVIRDGDRWYINFCCQLPTVHVAPPNTSLGIDLGVEKFAAFSTGEIIANPRFFRRAEKKLKARQKTVSRCQKGSHRRNRAKRILQNAHRKVRNQRRDFLHKLSRRLVNEYGTIVMEVLEPANLSQRQKPKLDATQTEASGQPVYAPNGQSAKSGLNKSIRDAGWGMFQQYVTYKAAEAGRIVLLVNPAYTSQTCSGCGAVKAKDLAERWHSCPCGVELDRDVNAAVNILRRGIGH